MRVGRSGAQVGFWVGGVLGALVSVTACHPTNYRCGPGTYEEAGQCVARPVSQVRCDVGTLRVGDLCVGAPAHFPCAREEAFTASGDCVPIQRCGEGTVRAGASCVPAPSCGAGRVGEDGRCACDAGARFDGTLGVCVPLPCGPGERFVPADEGALTHGGAGEGACEPIDALCGEDTTFDPETGACAATCPEPEEALRITSLRYDDAVVLNRRDAGPKRIGWRGVATFPVRVRYILNAPCPSGTSCELAPHTITSRMDELRVEGYSCNGLVADGTRFPFALYLEDAEGRTSQVVPAPFVCKAR